jgi:hypothetical protein
LIKYSAQDLLELFEAYFAVFGHIKSVEKLLNQLLVEFRTYRENKLLEFVDVQIVGLVFVE